MSFDPDAYLQSQKPSFDPDAYLAKKPKEEEQEPETSGAMAAIEAFGNAVTLGYLPHLQALVESTLPNPTAEADEELRELGIETPEPEGYVDYRDKNIKRQQKQAEEHPYLAGAGTVGGIVSGGVMTGGLHRLAGLGKAATGIGRAKEAIKAGAALGAIANPGDEEGELSPGQLGERAKNAGIGAVVGGLAQGGAEGAGKVAKVAGKALKRSAERRAFKALGPDLRAVRQSMDRDQIQKIGRTLLNSGVIKGRHSREKMQELIKQAKTAKGDDLDRIITELGKAQEKLFSGTPGLVKKGAPIPGIRAGVNRKKIADSLRKDLINKNTEIPGIAKKNRQLEKYIREFENGSDDLIPILKAEELKKSTGKAVNWDRLPGADIPPAEQVQRALYTKLKVGVEDATEVMDDIMGKTGAGRFKTAKSDFGNLAQAEKILDKRLARDTANRFISPSDYLTGGVGAATGFASGDTMEQKIAGALIGASLGGVNRFGRRYGNQITAKTADKMAKAILKIPHFSKMAQDNPTGFQGMIQRMMERIQSKGLQPGKVEKIFSPNVLEMFEKNPDLIDSVQNEELRKKLRKHFKIREPSKIVPQRKHSSKGPDAWARRGIQKLGIKDDAFSEKLLKSKEGRRLLIEASDLKPGSPRLKKIREKIKKGWGSK